MPSNHLILCHSLLLLPSIFPSITDIYLMPYRWKHKDHYSELQCPEGSTVKTAASKSCLFARPSLTGHNTEYDLRRWSRYLHKPTSLPCSIQNDLASPVVPCSSPPPTTHHAKSHVSLPSLFLAPPLSITLPGVSPLTPTLGNLHVSFWTQLRSPKTHHGFQRQCHAPSTPLPVCWHLSLPATGQ